MTEEPPTIPIPETLRGAVERLANVTPGDVPHMRRLLSRPEYVTRAGIAWLAALVARSGAKYDDANVFHRGPHTWPLSRIIPYKP